MKKLLPVLALLYFSCKKGNMDHGADYFHPQFLRAEAFQMPDGRMDTLYTFRYFGKEGAIEYNMGINCPPDTLRLYPVQQITSKIFQK